MRRGVAWSAVLGLATAFVGGLTGGLGCGNDTTSAETSADTGTDTGSEGDGDPGDGDGDPGDGDGDPGDGDPGDGDGDPGDGDGDPGDGDGDPGDGDGDPGDGDGDPDPACALPLEDLDASLIGALQPPGSCDDFVFMGTLEGGGGGVWNLDSCPCNTLCFAPDPYQLTLTVPDPELLPDPVMCPRVRIRRDPDTCALRSVIIDDLDQAGAPVWIASREPTPPPGVAELSVTPVDELACDGFEQWALELSWAGTAVTVGQGDSAPLPVDPPWTAANYASRTSDQGSSFAWLLTR